MNKTMEQAITEIAVNVLEIETLETRKSDSLDFHDLSVWYLKEALEAAYCAGMASVVKEIREEAKEDGRAKEEPRTTPLPRRRPNHYERTKNAVYATGNKWAIENFNATH